LLSIHYNMNMDIDFDETICRFARLHPRNGTGKYSFCSKSVNIFPRSAPEYRVIFVLVLGALFVLYKVQLDNKQGC